VGGACPRHLAGALRREELQMCNQNEWIVREAFLAYERGDIARLMDFV
jgi:hypothetical protein